MGKAAKVALLGLAVLASFAAGFWQARRGAVAQDRPRKVLYYVDPMHPAYRSASPGVAPDCGMQLEPVYADGTGSAGGAGTPGASLPLGTVRVSPELQQVIGVRVGPVERSGGIRTLRALGRVAADENRIHRILTAAEGWIRQLHSGTTGSLVQLDQLLATFYSRDLLGSEQAYFFAQNAQDRFKTAGSSHAQLESTGNQVRVAEGNLLSLGMSQTQLRELERTRKPAREIEVRSPATGLVLSRNVFPNLRFDRGTELYRIADLSRVWVFAEVFESEAHFFKAGAAVRLSLPGEPGKTLAARVSNALPQFDAATRTFQVRLEAENLGYALRPDMFVDVELPVSMPPSLVVPAEAVLDSGLRKTVFVDRGNGFFEPRKVETGWGVGDRVEIVRGLMAGERVVVSGNFLLDSESRMKAAASGIYGTPGECAVCGMPIDVGKTKAAGRTADYKGKTYLFCSEECRREFLAKPERYAASASVSTGAPVMAPMPGMPHTPSMAPMPSSAPMPAAGAHAAGIAPAPAMPPHAPGDMPGDEPPEAGSAPAEEPPPEAMPAEPGKDDGEGRQLEKLKKLTGPSDD